MKKPSNTVKCVLRGPYPILVFVTFSRRAYNAVMKRNGIKVYPPFVHKAGSCNLYETPDGFRQVLITADFAKLQVLSRPQAYAVLAHEALHAWQFIKQDAGIVDADVETEAYTTQWIAQGVFEEFESQLSEKS